MKLTNNKTGIIRIKIINRVYWEESNIRNSHLEIGYNQPIWVSGLITSNNLILNIHDEIRR